MCEFNKGITYLYFIAQQLLGMRFVTMNKYFFNSFKQYILK